MSYKYSRQIGKYLTSSANYFDNQSTWQWMPPSCGKINSSLLWPFCSNTCWNRMIQQISRYLTKVVKLVIYQQLSLVHFENENKATQDIYFSSKIFNNGNYNFYFKLLLALNHCHNHKRKKYACDVWRALYLHLIFRSI